MTVANLFAKHIAGEVSKEKFLYEVRKDSSLPWITNLISYSDAIKILKNKGIIKESNIEEDVNVPDSIKIAIKELKNIQDKLDSALSAYEESIKELQSQKGKIVPEVLNAFKGQTQGAEQLKFEVDDLLVKLVNEHERSNISYKTLSELLEEELIKIKPEITEVIQELKKSSYTASKVKGQLNIGNSKIYEEDDSFDQIVLNSLNKSSAKMNKNIKSAIGHIHRIESSLNPKDVIKEEKDLYLQIDRLNPILVNKAINSELEKLDKVDAEMYQTIAKKVVKKLQKDPHAYDDVFVTNAKQIRKDDEKLKMEPVKKDNFKDEAREMKKVKGVEVAKANTKTSKKENKKGKPKGVKEMSKTAKTQKGIAVMESLLEFMFKKKLNEDVHHTYARGQQVSTPDGDGIVDGIVADTVSVKFDNDDIKDYQMNALEHYKELAKEKPAEPEVKKFEPEVIEDKRDTIIKKIMELLKKKKAVKKEAITAKSTDSTHNTDVLNKINKVQGQARTDLQKAFNSGKAIDV